MKKHLLLLFAALALLTAPGAMRAQTTVTIGEEGNISSAGPFASFWNYSFSEMVYTAAEIGMPSGGTITKIRYHLESSSPTQTNNITLYMKNVSRSTFSNSSDYESLTVSDIVYNGNVTFSPGWCTITLTTPFVYDGTSNLMIACDENTIEDQELQFYSTDKASSCLYYYSDSSNPDPYNLAIYAGNKGVYPYRADIQFEFANTVTIAGETGSSPESPYASAWNYSVTEQIYTAEEIGVSEGGIITSIQFRQESVASETNHITVFMKNVSRSSFASTSDYEALSADDIVYEGDFTFSLGWCSIPLDVPFNYDGTSNLMIAIHENTPGHMQQTFYYKNVGNSVYRLLSDSEDPDPYDIGSSTASKYISDRRAIVKIAITPFPTSSPTVNDGSATNGYVPVYGFYADAYLKAEFVMPSSSLTSIGTGNEITDMTFYAASGYDNISWPGSNFLVFLKEVESTTLSTYTGYGDATVVYEGDLSIVDGQMKVTFTTPYTYQGGNLLIGVYNTEEGDYNSSYWLGVSAPGASIQGYNYDDIDEAPADQRDFLPKTTFGVNSIIDFEPGNFSQFTFANHAPYPWTVEAAPTDCENCGSYCMRSGNAGVHSSSSTIEAVYDFASVGTISFDAKCMGEGTSTLWDHCDFLIDGVQQFTHGADLAGWNHYEYTVPAGSHTFTWKYIKDSSENPTGDGFFVDNIKFGSGYPCDAPENLAVTQIDNSHFTVTWDPVLGATGYDLEIAGLVLPTIPAPTTELSMNAELSETTKTAKVRAHCAGGELSDWTQITFMPYHIYTTANWYGYAAYSVDGEDWEEKFISFNMQDLATVTPATSTTVPQMYAATYANGYVWSITTGGDLLRATLDNSSRTISDFETLAIDYETEGVVRSMAHNPADGRIYYIYSSNGTTTTTIKSFDPTSPSLPELHAICDRTIMTLAINGDGDAVGVELSTGDLYELTLATGSCQLVGNTGQGCNYVQSMAYDLTQFELFWAQIDNIGNGLYKVNPSTTETAYIGKIGGGEGVELVGMFKGDDYEITCQPPTNLTISNVGPYSADVSWTGPSDGNEWTVQYSTSPDFSTNVTDFVTTTTTQLTGLTPETTYYVHVNNFCGTMGASVWTYAVSFTTEVACPAPTDLAADNITGSSAEVSWTGTGDSYTVRYRPSSILFSDDFENGLGQWTLLDNDGDGHNWFDVASAGSLYSYYDGSNLDDWVYNGSNAAVSGSYINGVGALTPDNWLITPQIHLGGQVSFVAKSADASYPEHFAVYVSTTGTNPADFTMVSAEFESSSDWESYDIDLSSFSGQQGYVAIRNFDVYDQYLLVVDDFVISSPGGPWQTVVTTSSDATITGLNSETYYESQVQSDCGVEGMSSWSNMVTFTTTTASACPAPTNFTVSNVGSNGAGVSWTQPGDGDHWIVQYSTNADFSNSSEDPVGSTSWYIYGLTPSTTYYLRVANDCGSDGISAWSNTETFTTTESPCIAPTDLTVSNISYNGAELSWDQPGGGFDWLIEYSTNPDFSSAIGENSFDTYWSLIELNPITTYYVRVSNDCGTLGNSEWVTTSFTTTGGVIVIPDIIDFEPGDFSQYPFDNSSSYPWIIADASNGCDNGSTYCMRSGNAEIASSSSVIEATYDYPAPGYIVFDAKCMGEGTSTLWDHCDFLIDGTLQFKHGADIADAGWLSYAFIVTAGSHTFTWSYTKDSSVNPTGDGFFVDNIQFGVGEPCVSPYNLAVNAVPNGSATVSWGGYSSSYVLRYRPEGGAWTTVTGITDETYTITGLPVGIYEVEVAPECDPTALSTATFTIIEVLSTANWYGYANYTEPAQEWQNKYISFSMQNPSTVEIATTTTAPVTYAASYANGYVWCITSSGDLMRATLDNSSKTISDFETIVSGFEPTHANGMSYNPLDGRMYYIMYEDKKLKSFDPAQPDNVAEVGTLDISPITLAINSAGEAYCVELSTGDFYQVSLSDASATLVDNTGLNVNYAQDMAFDLITGELFWAQTYSTSNNALYKVDPATAQTHLLGHIGNASTVQLTGLFIGYDYEIACVAPTNLTVSNVEANSAELSWTGPADGNEWEYQYSTSPDFSTFEHDFVNSTAVQLTGLTPETTYYVHVRNFCGTTGSSLWSNTVSFTTPELCPDPYDLVASDITGNSANVSWTGFGDSYTVRYRPIAFHDDFESGLGQWTQIDADGDGYIWLLGSDLMSSGYSAHGGTDIVISQSYASGYGALTPDNYLVTPQITLGGQVELWAKAQDDEYPSEHFSIAVSTAGNTDPDDFQTLFEWTMTPGGWYQYTIDLSAYAGQQGYVALRHHDCTDMFYLDIDDFIIYDPTAPWTTVTTNSSLLTLSGLDPETQYEFQVQSDCGVDGTSDWSNLACFTTTNASACPAPTNLTVSNISHNGAELSWNQPDGGFDWLIEYSTNSDFSSSTFENSFETHWSLTGLSLNTTYYVRVANDCGTMGISEWLTTSFTTNASACPKPTGLHVEDLSSDNAVLYWTENGSATSWSVGIATTLEDLSSADYHNATTQSYDFSHTLVPGTTYYAAVQSNCGGSLHSILSIVSFTTPSGSEPVPLVEIGSGTSTENHLPTYILYSNTLSQQIYTAAEIGQAGDIYHVAFYNTYIGGSTTRNMDIYMLHTDKTAFLSSSDWVPVTAADRVFSGNVIFGENSWVTIEFPTPFAYNGTDNLVLIVDDNTGSWTSSRYFRVFDAPSQAIYIYSDGTNYDPYNPSAYTGTVLNKKNQIQLGFAPILCHKPSNLAVSDVGKTSATLNWTENDAATEWQICVNGDEANAITVTTKPYLLTGLTPGTDYTVKVRANCGGSDGVSAWSSSYTFTTLPLCLVPSNLTFSNVGKTSAELSWTENGEATEWQICVDGDEANATTVTTKPYLLTGLTPGTNYTVKVRANCGGSDGVSAWSAEWTFTTLPLCPVPSNLTVSNVGKTSAELSWTENGEATEWQICIYDDEANAITVTTKPYTLTGLTPGTVYTVKVRANCGGSDGMSAWSSSYTFTTLPACLVPTSLTVSNITPTSAILSWTENNEATEWQVCVNGDETNAITVTTNPYMLTGLTPYTTYTVYVRANCGGSDGVSAWSNGRSFTTISDIPVLSTANWYGYAAYTVHGEDWKNKYISFSMQDPSSVTAATSSTVTDNFAAAYANGYVWCITTSGDLLRAVLDNNSRTIGGFETIVSGCETETAKTMSYNPVDGKMYYIVGSSLKSFDPSQPDNITEIGFMDLTLQTLAINSSGVAYGVEYSTGGLYQVNLTDASSTLVGSTGQGCSFVQDMAFDLTTNELFWAQISSSTELGIYKVDPATAATYYLGQIGGGAEITGLFMGDDYEIACVAPTNLTVSNVEAYSAELTWTETGTATNWDYQIDTDPAFPNGYMNQYNLSANPISLGSLTPETTYYVRVRSYCGGEAGHSYWSAPVSFTTPEACPTPTDVTVESQNTIAIISWTENGTATGWQICIDEDEANAITVTENPYMLTGLTPGTNHTVKVRANCSGIDGDSDWSGTVNFSTYSCEEPTVLTAEVTLSSVNLTWDGHSNEYVLAYRPVGTTEWTDIENINTNSYTLTGLTPGNYEAQVSSSCSAGNWASTTFTVFEVQSTANWYGFSASSYDAVNAYKFISFTMHDPETVTAATGTLDSGFGRGCAYVNGYLWNLTENGDLTRATVDNDNKVISAFETVVSGFETSGTPVAMSYNPIDGRLYYIFWNSYALKSFDPAQPDDVTTVGECSIRPITIAINSSGEAYCVEFGSGDLYQLNLNDASVTLVGSTGHPTNYAQSMAFDNQTGELFWAQHYSVSSDNYGLYKVNPATAATYYLGRIGGEYVQCAGMFMVGDETPCPAPTDLAVESVGIGGAEFSWTSGNDYNLRFREVGGEWVNVNYWAPSPYFLQGLDANTEYEVQAQVDCGSDGLSAWGNLVTFTTLPCPAPTNLTVSGITFTSAELSWNHGGGDYEWNVEYSTSSDFSSSETEWVLSTSWSLTGLVPATTYYVRVQSICPLSIPGGWTSTLTFTTEECPAPTNVTVSNITATSAEVNWTQPGAGYEWNVEYSTSSDFSTYHTAWAIGYPWTLDNLVPGTTYYVRVKSSCYDPVESSSIEGGTSDAVSFTTSDVSCSAPTNLAVSNVTNHTAELSWTENSSAVIWYVMVNGDEAQAIEITDNPFTLTGLTPETTYTVAVRSDCGYDMLSDWSSPASFTTLEACLPPTDLTVSSTGAVSAVLTWTSGDIYNLRYRTSSGGSWVEILGDTLTSPAAITGLQASTTYEVQAQRFCGADGYSVWGNTVSFTTESCAVPTDLEIVSVTATSITVTWASGLPYNVSYRSSGLWSILYNRTPPVTITDLTPGTEYRIRVQDVCMTGLNGSAYYSTVQIVNTAACTTPDDVAVANITDNSATVSWTSGDTYNLRYREAGGEWTDVTGVTSPYTITGLHANASYEVAAQHDCGSDGVSDWGVTIPFTAAPCDPIAVPYAYDFETEDPYYCWRPVAGNVVRSHVSAASYNHTSGGEYALALFESASDVVALPQFAQETNGLQVMFWLRPQNNVFSGHGTFEVGYLTDVADASTFTAVSTYSYDDWASNGYVRKIVAFPGAPAGATIAFRHNSPTANGIWYVDDILVSAVCPMPENIVVTNVTNNSATVTWTDNGAASWDVSLVDLDAYAYNTTTNQYTLTGLNAGATYNIKVRSNCGDGVVSDWSEKVYFTTSTNVVPSYATITGESSVCQSHVTLLTAHTDVEATYLWSTNETTQQITAGPGTYWVKVTSTTGDQLTSETFTVAGKPNFAVTESRSVCPGEMPYTWNGFTFTLPGTQAVTLTASNGCDSVVTMTLTVSPTYNTPVSAAICQGESYSFGGHSLTSGGVYYDTLQSQAGCDSVITLTLTVNPTYAVPDTRTICAGELPYTWNGVTFEAAGTQTVTLPTVHNCDSVVTMTLNVNPEYTTPLSAVICQGESYSFAGQNLTVGGVYRDSLQTVSGCDSVVVLTLTVNPTYAVTDEATICPSELPYTWNGVTFEAAGTQTATMQTVNHCDSVVTMTLHVNPAYTVPMEASICNGEAYTFFGQLLTISGEYTHQLQTVDGCDSVVVLTLTVNPTYAVTEQRTVCPAGLPYTWNGVFFTGPATKFATLQTVSGCDSVVTMTLTVADAFEVTETREVCVSELPYVWNGKTFTSAGTKYAELTASNGCDSIVTMVLVVNTPVNQAFTVSACGSYTWTDGVTYTASGDHTYSHPDVHGCAQVDTLHLTIYNPVHQAYNVEACGSYTWADGDGQTYMTSGDRTYSHEDAHGCTQVDTLHLTIYNPVHQSYEVEACESYTWADGDGQTYTTSGDRTYSHDDAHGCTQVDTLHLTIHNPVHQSYEIEACGSYMWADGDGQTYTTSGDRTFSHEDAHGCTQVDTLHLTIHNPVHQAYEVEACESYTWADGDGQTYTTSGIRTYSHEDAHGCTQVDTLHLTIYNPVHTAITVEECGSYTWVAGDGVTYYASGDYTYSHEDAHGCTQVDTLHLTIHTPANQSYTVAECGSYTWTDGNGQTYTVSGDYTHSHLDAHGCTQVDTLHLTILQSSSAVVANTVCAEEMPYEWNGVTFNQAGMQTATIEAANGCDSVVTMVLMVNTPVHHAYTAENCGSYTWVTGNGQTYYASGDYTYAHPDVNGCTQVDTLHLTILQPANQSYSVSECGSYTWTAGTGQTYTASGDYTYAHQDANGCTQVDTLHLTIFTPENTAYSVSECESYVWNGTTYTVSGDYTYSHLDAHGCTQVDTLHLTIFNPVHQAYNVEACGSYTWADGNGQTYYASGVHTYSHQDAHGCTQVDTLHLTILQGTSSVIANTICADELPYEWNGVTFTAAGIQTATIVAANGCDSVVTMVLTVNTPAHGSVTVEECGSYTWQANGQTYTASGDYTYSHQDVNGCTQVDTLHLTILTPVNTAVTVSECGSYTWAANGQTYSASGDYTYSHQDANGCTQVDTLHLTIHNPVHTAVTETACGSYTWAANGQTYTASGDYTYSHLDANGCTQVDTLHLTIGNVVTSDLYVSSCGSYYWNNANYTETGNYTVTFTASGGCDSVVTLHLTINQAVQTELYETACDSYTWTDGNTYTQSDDYSMTLTAANCCDSVVVLHLTVNQSASSEFSIETSDSCYTWNNQTYCASGDYVQTLQTVDGCDSVVTLHLTTSVGVEVFDASSIYLAPNPAESVCRIVGLETEPVSVELFDMRGKLLLRGDKTEFDVRTLPTGMYTVRVNTGEHVVNLKLIRK